MKRTISFLFTLYLVVTLFLIFFVRASLSYYLKAEFIIGDKRVTLIALILFLLIALPAFLRRKTLEPLLESGSRYIVPGVLTLLFIFEVVFVCSAFFYSDWDPAGVIDAAIHLLRDQKEDISINYLSAHPNNLMLVFIYHKILLLGRTITGQESILPIAVFQCMIFTLSGGLVFSITRRLYGSYIVSYLTLIIYILAVGLSPWIIITYSDQLGLFFPLLILWIYLKIYSGRDEGFITSLTITPYLIIGVLASFGYSVKPQTVIVYIAVLAASFIELIKGPSSRRDMMIRIASSAVGFILMYIVIHLIIFPSMGLSLEKGKAFPMTHYFMMGLNEKSDGVYIDEDGALTDSIADPREKRMTNLKVAGERISAFGPAGLAEHLKKKQLVNYADGTFAYGIDGNFFAGRTAGDNPPVKENLLTPFFDSFILPDGSCYDVMSTARQGLWLLILLFCTVSGIYFFAFPDDTYDPSYGLFIIQLTLLGLTFFELLFEAKARYLFVYLPFFILASCGFLRRIK
jgi:hypothetical protein